MGWLTAAEKLASGPSSIAARGQFGKGSVIWKTYGMKVVRCRYYTPTNPQTSLQQSWRGVFASGMSAWGALSSAEKASWRNIQKRVRCYRRKQAHNVYLGKFLKGESLDPAQWWDVNGP